MRPLLSKSSAVVLLAGGLACASAPKQPNTAPSVAVQAGSGQLGPALIEWSGKFRSTRDQSGQGVDYRGLNVASGRVLLTAPDERNIHAVITVSGPSGQNGTLRWALAQGACRSGTIPLMPVSSFPEIRMNDGHGELDQVVSVPLPTSGNYHVNIYTAEGTDESDVMTCAELKLERRHG